MNTRNSSAVQKQVKFSIVIPVYNAEDFLAEAFRSILSQSLARSFYEVIVIDDGSDDSSLQIIKRFERWFPCFKYFTQTNRGVSAARNKGIEMATGEYVLFLDADDTFKPDAFSIAYQVIDASDADIYFFDAPYSAGLRKYNSNEFLSQFYFSVYVWKTCIKTSFIRERNLRFAEGYILEDGVFLLEAIVAAAEIATFEMDLVSYNVNELSLTRDYSSRQKNIKMISSFVFIINRYQQIIESIRGSVSDLAYLNLLERKESFVFFMFFRMMRYKFSNRDIETAFRKIEFSGHFRRFPGSYNKKLIYKLFLPIVMNKILRNVFVNIYRIMTSDIGLSQHWVRIKSSVFLRQNHLLEME